MYWMKSLVSFSRHSRQRSVAIAAGFAAFSPALALAQQPLPAKTDIPADYSTTICPDAASAQKLLTFVTVKPAPENHIIDVDRFFEGLSATGCAQSPDSLAGPVMIKRALARHAINLADGPEVHLAYAGTDAQGRDLFGVVNETGNDKAPRTPLERWLSDYAPNGILIVEDGVHDVPLAYRCGTVTSARRVVTAISESDSISDDAKQKAFESALKSEKCTAATGRFSVTAVHEERAVGCGYECAAVWTALAAKDATGDAIGLIFDGGMM